MEAILRLRLVGTGVPVLRLDHDVAFNEDNEDNKKVGDLGLFKAVACAVRAYRARVEQPAISTFMFSASYDSRPLLTKEGDAFGGWSRAFATRIFPALIADPVEVSRIRKLSNQAVEWRRYEIDNLDEDLARRYYGLKPMLPYEYAGGITYNAIHNTGISNWIPGHPLLPKEWSKVTTGSRDGKPFPESLHTHTSLPATGWQGHT